MRYFDVKGMSCAACSARVEKAVSRLENVEACSVSLLTNSMSVEGTATDAAIISAVSAAGYSAALQTGKIKQEKSEAARLLKRFTASLVFMLVLMYLAMGHMIGLPQIPVFSKNPVACALVQMVLCITVMLVNRAFFISGAKAVFHRSPNMDSLVSLGSAAAFVYSVAMLFVLPEAELLHGLYFESAAMILTLITLGKTLEAHAKGKTTSAVKALIDLAPKTANVLRDGKEIAVDISEISVGDVFVVRPGESIATDGIIIRGCTSVDESAITGESVPVDKGVSDSVTGATVNRMGYIECKATKVGEDTALSKIIRLMNESAATKAPIAKIADKVSGFFVPAVILIAVITVVVWLLLDTSFGFALSKGISVLVISCPCALGLATPVAIMVGSGRAAKEGILFKTAEALENIGKADIVVLDKTGTVTSGKPSVTDIVPFGCSESELLLCAASLEAKSEHPLAKAIVKRAESEGKELYKTENFEVVSGSGVAAVIAGEKFFGGNYKYISQFAEIDQNAEEIARKLAYNGKTAVFFVREDKPIGVIALADTLKPDSKEAVNELKDMGLKTVLLTGDNEYTARAVSAEISADEVVSDVLPQDKAAVITELKKQGRVIMVGDGINDAPALSVADIGVAIGTGTDIAVTAADTVVMNGSLSEVVKAVRTGRTTLRNIKQNLFWAFAYNVIGIPIAAGVFVGFGLELNPMIAAAAMSLSSFCVVINALRLQHIRFTNKKDGRYEKMTVTVKTEGMMCPHCEAHVKTALEQIKGVKEAAPDHKTGLVVITLEEEVPVALLESTISAQGYKVVK